MKTILIGACGHQGREYLPILASCSELVALVDINACHTLDKIYQSIRFNNLDTVLATIDFDTAVLTVPHGSHFDITKKLLKYGKNVIKEKPFAITQREADFYIANVGNNQAVFTITQRSANPLFIKSQSLINSIEPYAFHYRYFMNKSQITTGWRSHQNQALGGVGLDMGYHIVDVLNTFFGMPDTIHGQFAYRFEQMAQQFLDDYLSFQVGYALTNIVGQVSLARHNFYKEECLEILGRYGSLRLTPSSLEVFDNKGLKVQEENSSSTSQDMITHLFGNFLNNRNNRHFVKSHMAHHLNNVRFIESLYQQMSPNFKAVA